MTSGGGKRGCVRKKTLGQRVRVNLEDFVQRIHRETTRLDAVVSLQHRAGDKMRARIKPRKSFGLLERMQALSVRGARRWCGRAHATKIHACRQAGFRHHQLTDALIGNGIGSGPGDGDGGRGRGGNGSGDGDGDGDGNSVCAFIFSIRFHPLPR